MFGIAFWDEKLETDLEIIRNRILNISNLKRIKTGKILCFFV